MITGDIKVQIERIWDSFWSGGISNPLEVIEQMTYLLCLRRPDDIFRGYGGVGTVRTTPGRRSTIT